jgi:2'-hydroxyisoflavone reductase
MKRGASDMMRSDPAVPVTGPPVAPTSPRRAHRIHKQGGTSFLGPPQVTYALGRGHEVTLFNRGQTNADLFPEVEKLRGDRNDDLESLRGRSWDVVIDNSATNPAWVRATAGLLRGSVEHYIYVSSISAYREMGTVPMTSAEPVFTYENAGVPTDGDEAELPYGLAKAQSEREAEIAFPGKTTVVRPGLIVGPHDPSDRFTYWVERIARGGSVLAPGPQDWKVEFSDVRDLSKWIVHAAEQRLTGVYNASGPRADKVPLGEFLECCRETTSSDAKLQWVDESWLTAQGVQMWSDLPMRTTGDSPGFSTRSTQKAIDAGLTFRPMPETIADTLAWSRSRSRSGESAPLKSGLTPDRESELLAQLPLS